MYAPLYKDMTPMSRIFLLRHAKASWPEPGMRDFDRPLAPRGIEDARKIGTVMRAAEYRPERVICSTALRTRQTWHQIAPQLDIPEQNVVFEDQLYDSDNSSYIEAIQSSRDAESVLIVGHNPMIEDVASALAAGGSDSAMRRLSKGFPTSGLAIIKFEGGLNDVTLSGGYLEDFLRPSSHPHGDGNI